MAEFFFLTRLRQFLDFRLKAQYISFVSLTLIVLSLAVAIVQFFTFDRGYASLGVPFGADFSGFYVAAQILNRGRPDQLYDRQLHYQLYHELLPDEDQRTSIPYVHPPFVAGFLRPLAHLRYADAVAIWLVISATFYVFSFSLLLNVLRWPDKAGLRSILLIAISFEPFLLECWLGGQLSAIAFFSYALCFVSMKSSKAIWAGVALGLCFYKPTLLILILPMLVVGRRWKILMGMTITGLGLALLSVMFVGWNVSLRYLFELASFSQSTSSGEIEIRTWKYVDLNNCLKLVLGTNSSFQKPLFVLFGGIPLISLARNWWVSDKYEQEFQHQLWATTITWVPVLNLYVGIYDSILVVQSILMTSTWIVLSRKTLTPLTSSGFSYFILLIFVTPWFSQNLAAVTGVSLYTVLLIALGIYQLHMLSEMRCKVGSEPATFRWIW